MQHRGIEPSDKQNSGVGADVPSSEGERASVEGGVDSDDLEASDPAAGEDAANDDNASVDFIRQFMQSFDKRTGSPESAAVAEDAQSEMRPDGGAVDGPVDPAIDGELPDVGFTLAEAMTSESDSTEDVAERAKALSHEIARTLAAVGPEGWRRLEAVFVLTTSAEMAQVVFADSEQRVLRMQPEEDVLALVREQRHVSAQLADGPWWRLLLTLSSVGEIEVDYDYGDEPFPDDQIFPREIYFADLDAYPRRSLPVWLAAYLTHDGRQSRTPKDAAEQARVDRDNGVRGVLSEYDFPDFPLLSARWAVISAAFVAAQSEWGPRVLPALDWFEGSKRSGSTLYALPGNRAVLSGGVWNAPALDAAYNGGEVLPALYAGAPEWVANAVLNPRAANGLLSFCYWWDNGRWYRGESPSADQLSAAVPGIWTSETVVDVVVSLVSAQPSEELRAAVARLVASAEAGAVTREILAETFGQDGAFDLDSAFYQLSLAGVIVTLPEPMPQDVAIDRVGRYMVDNGLQNESYSVEKLRAERLSVGWMVYVPTEPGEVAIGRAIFYLADDGVLEQSSSSVAPSIYATEFEQRFHQRRGTPAA